MSKSSSSPVHSDTLPEEAVAALAEALEPIAPPHAQAIKARVLRRVREADPYVTVRASEGRWITIAPSVECKRVQADGVAEAYFLRLHPGARLPAHAHAEDELCVVIEGHARLGEIEVGPGDFHLARAGSHHGEIQSACGALLFIRTAPATHAPG